MADDDRSLHYCPSCNAKYDVSGVISGKRFICKSCRVTIQIPEGSGQPPFFKLSESRELLKPELLMDDDERPSGGSSFAFTKMVATENDYVLVDCFRETVDDPETLAKVVCHRRRGAGSDGILLFMPSSEADFRMGMFNPDGSEAEMCGNGIRCLARYAFDHEYTDQTAFTVETLAGVREVQLSVQGDTVLSIRVDMGTVTAGDPVTLEAAGRNFEGVPVDVGNPHFVIFVDDVDDVDLETWGPAIEHHEHFPNRTNVEFVQVVGPELAAQRTHERGVGETRGCGTGATAVCAAGISQGRTKRAILLHLKGGDLSVEVDEENRAYLTGPAVEVFSGTWIPGGIRQGAAP